MLIGIPMQKIVIVGGGAGGLELASRLSRTLGRKKQAEITLGRPQSNPYLEAALT